MDEYRKQLAKKYEKIKLTVSIIEGIASLVILILFLSLGYSKKLEIYAFSFTSNPYLALVIYGAVVIMSSVTGLNINSSSLTSHSADG